METGVCQCAREKRPPRGWARKIRRQTFFTFVANLKKFHHFNGFLIEHKQSKLHLAMSQFFYPEQTETGGENRYIVLACANFTPWTHLAKNTAWTIIQNKLQKIERTFFYKLFKSVNTIKQKRFLGQIPLSGWNFFGDLWHYTLLLSAIESQFPSELYGTH